MRVPCIRSGWWLCAVALLGATLLAAGCDTRPKVGETVPVSGMVKMGDRPLNGGMVTFIPDEGAGNKSTSRPTGTIGSDGKYTLSTSSATDSKTGAPPGKYKVTVASAPMMGMADPSAAPQGVNPAAPTGMAVQIDAKFANPATSGLSMDVSAGGGPYDLILK